MVSSKSRMHACREGAQFNRHFWKPEDFPSHVGRYETYLQGDSVGYFLRGSDDPTYLPGRSAEIVAYGKVVGRLGVLHPETLAKFELNLPISAMEINLEHFL